MPVKVASAPLIRFCPFKSKVCVAIWSPKLSAPAPGVCHERIFPFTVSTWLSPPFASFVKVFADDAYKILPCSKVVSRSNVFPFTSNDLPFTEFEAMTSVNSAVAPFTFKVVRTLFAVKVLERFASVPLNFPPLNN